MLPAGQQSDVYTGTGEVLANLAAPDHRFIYNRRCDVMEMHAAAADAGFDMLDALISGGVTGAEAGTLTIMRWFRGDLRARGLSRCHG